MFRWLSVAMLVALVGCDTVTTLSDAAERSDGDAGVAARDTGADAGTDARAPACASGAATAWDLDTGAWSTDYAPRGISGELPIAIDLAWHDDELYVGGLFTHVGSLAAANVAAWSRARGWRALGEGLADLIVGRLAIETDGRVAAAGLVRTTSGGTSYGAVRVLDAGVWTSVGETDSQIADLAYDADGTLLAAGAFTTIGGVTSLGLARWDGATWEDVPTGRANATAILVDELGTCVAGSDALGVYVACRAAGVSAWAIDNLPPQPDVEAAIDSMTRDAGGALIVAGRVEGGVLRSDGASWAILGGGLRSIRIGVTRAADGVVWAVGQIEDWPGSPGPAANVVRLVDGEWSPVGAGVYRSAPFAVVAAGADVIVGGDFEAAMQASGDAVAARGVARWDGASWSALEQPGATELGLDHVTSLGLGPDCELLAAGTFVAAGDHASASVAMLRAGGVWESPTDEPLEGARAPHVAIGPDGTAYAELVFDLEGSSGLARLRDGAWDRIAEIDRIRGMAFARDGTMYVGGFFEEGLLAWDGSAWSTVGSRAAAPVGALAIDGDALWATDVGLSRFEGGVWTSVATGLEHEPSAVIDWRGAIVLVGTEVLAHGSRIVRVRESWFEPLPFDEALEINDAATFGSALIVVGREVFGASSVGFARWTETGGTWHELGAFDGAVNDIVVRGDSVLFAGDFQSVDGVASMGLAELRAP